MKLLGLITLFIPLASAGIIPLPQHPLSNIVSTATRHKVPGDNPAYYFLEDESDQLLDITEFTISPYPPLPNHRIFFYLRTTSGTRSLPGLANATLEIWANRPKYPDEPEYEYKNKISDFRLFYVRDLWEARYGGPLIEGINEMVGDYINLQFGPDHGRIEADVEVIARLPDERVLFAFQAWVSYEV